MAQKPDRDEASGTSFATPREAARVRDRIRGELERRGVSPELAGALALRLEQVVTALGVSGCQAVCAAALAASDAPGAPPALLARSAHELDEIQRLMGAFVGELRKLDEALQLLATYLARIRDQAKGAVRQTVH
ncbi:MAG TPA: hypothetical protein DEP35_02165 [Deltaproteobacteria bacterium]|jgi:hypothetical protein|nr:hypothetical protein [Deltaproteobacteria bacterium]